MKVNIGIRTLTICLLGLLILLQIFHLAISIDLPDLGEAASQHMERFSRKKIG